MLNTSANEFTDKHVIEIIPPKQFKTVSWKNGLGETTELAINPGGTLDNFDWRLSIASVVEDGLFSNFTGYTRNLILIDGNGINLQHNDSKIDKLSNLLDIAIFNGGDKTVGNLHSDDITDFNVITRTEGFNTNVIAEHKLVDYPLEKADLYFVYSLYRDAELIISDTKEVISLPAGHLLKIQPTCQIQNNIFASLTGTHLIVVYLYQQ
ncbi:HutD family protein [Colwellia sp. UCD-KL20]|uniref:HutD/Ves family protein n=1 Tax=Colwellia sp. UCD-KL20 TaxID=1917165 RepID=UPI001177A033|nr:HutD family protein [Colwellia sp. UCD-KL20]